MSRGPRWRKWEDQLLIEAATCNRVLGLRGTAPGDVVEAPNEAGLMQRLQAVADRTGRSLLAVRKRASRLKKRSYRSRVPVPVDDGHVEDASGIRYIAGMTMTDDEILARMEENERMYQPFHEGSEQ